MIILYRPHQGDLEDSMRKVEKFNSLKELLQYIVKQFNNAFAIDDIYIKYYCYDSRIDWDTFLITTKTYGMERFDIPQAIGYLTFK